MLTLRTVAGVSRIAALSALSVIAILSFAVDATAQTATQTAYYNNSPQPTSANFNVNVTATVTPPCQFLSAPSGSYDAGDINGAFTHDFDFTLDCRVPLRVAITSTNAGLLLPVSGSPPSGYTNLEPYNVTLHLEGDSSASAEATCTTTDLDVSLGSSPCGFFGTASTSNGLYLSPGSQGETSYVRVANGSGWSGSDILMASTSPGDYTDSLVVTVSAAQ